ncbi:hypothetical protein ACT453_10040, partial [Bacillus sp. D-CC]
MKETTEIIKPGLKFAALNEHAKKVLAEGCKAVGLIQEESIGIRIEDDILVTKDGHENLSKSSSTMILTKKKEGFSMKRFVLTAVTVSVIFVVAEHAAIKNIT